MSIAPGGMFSRTWKVFSIFYDIKGRMLADGNCHRETPAKKCSMRE
jgi:hypothetical protein